MRLPGAIAHLRRSIAVFVPSLLLVLANPAIAQELSAITGQVRDESGAVLPGVTVSVSSPVLQVKRSDRRDQRPGRVPHHAAADWHVHRVVPA